MAVKMDRKLKLTNEDKQLLKMIHQALNSSAKTIEYRKKTTPHATYTGKVRVPWRGKLNPDQIAVLAHEMSHLSKPWMYGGISLRLGEALGSVYGVFNTLFRPKPLKRHIAAAALSPFGTIIDEAVTSWRAYRALKRLGMRKEDLDRARKLYLKALSTYLTSPGMAIGASSALYGALKRTKFAPYSVPASIATALGILLGNVAIGTKLEKEVGI